MSSFDSIVTYGLNDEILFSSWYYICEILFSFLSTATIQYLFVKFAHSFQI